LFKKLVVIGSPLDKNWKRRRGDLVNAGMRVINFDGKPDSVRSIIRQLLDPPAALSVSERQHVQADRGIGSSQAHKTVKKEATQEMGRHPDQVVVLLVGHSGHGKSKTINRLIGQNLLEVGRVNSGSMTKVQCRTLKKSLPDQ
jgi:ribosome biogenesis GTPase A